MEIFHLYRKDTIGYEEFDGKVIVAETALRAREIANQSVGDEGRIWEDTDLVNCEVVNTKEEGIVLVSFNAG